MPGRGHSSMVTEEVRLLRTLVQDLETELKTKGRCKKNVCDFLYEIKESNYF